MRTKWFIIALILVVLPAAILSMLAARAIGHYELIIQTELKQDASRILSAVDCDVHDQMLQTLELVRMTLSGALAPSTGPEQLTPIARRLVQENDAITDVFVFMNPWGFLATSCSDMTQEERPVKLDLLANQLRIELADGAHRVYRSGHDAGKHRAIPGALPPDGGRSCDQSERSADSFAFLQNGNVYFFAPLPGTASVWAGYAIDRKTLDRVLTRSMEQYAAAGMVLSYSGAPFYDPDSQGDVVVSDSLSPETQLGKSAMDRKHPELPILASAFLDAPLDAIEILAQAAPGVEIQRIAAARTRLYGWGLAVVVVWVLVGIGIVMRQTVLEIHQARQRGEFLLGVSHDLRTPIASVRMLAESMAHGHVRKKEQPVFMETIVSECDRLSRLIERVLYLVRYGQGALVYVRCEINLGELVQQTVMELKTYAHSLQVRIEPNLPLVQGDRAALQQVVLNLLDNAIKYGKRESSEESATYGEAVKSDSSAATSDASIRVELAVDTVNRARNRWSRPATWVRLTVRDFGMGIARKEQRRIFRRFYRSSRAHDRNVSGVGLGLALCRHVIRSHGGWIEVESEVGEGTAFRVYLKRQ